MAEEMALNEHTENAAGDPHGAAHGAFYEDPTFVVLIGFIAFFAVLLRYRVPALITKALDDRADNIRKELDDARELREEAQSLLASYQRKQREAEKEAEDIIEQARNDAQTMAAEARAALAESIERRTKTAEEKIAQAENQAVADVRNMAADAAIKAARKLIADGLQPGQSDALVDKSIQDLPKHIN